MQEEGPELATVQVMRVSSQPSLHILSIDFSGIVSRMVLARRLPQRAGGKGSEGGVVGTADGNMTRNAAKGWYSEDLSFSGEHGTEPQVTRSSRHEQR
jgi:hypothetical protein